MTFRTTLTICIAVFLTVSSVAWAICVSSVYAPAKSALEICAAGWSERTPVFCSDLARSGR